MAPGEPAKPAVEYPARAAGRHRAWPATWRGRGRARWPGQRPDWRTAARKAVPAFWRSSWRRRRPFWGGLLLILSGLELLAIPLSGVLSHGGIKLVIYIGIGGVFGFLIGALLITAAIAAWVNPAHRAFYGIAGVILGIASFPASNLGGFFLGMLLAVIGGALAFAWTPSPPAGSLATPPATAGFPGSAGDGLDEPTGPTGGLATLGPGTSGADDDHGTGSGRAGDGTPAEDAAGDADGEGHWAGEYGSGDGPAPQGSAGRTLALAVMPLAMAAGMAGSGATATPQPT